MKRQLITSLFGTAALTLGICGAQAAELTGKVTLTGTPPSEKVIKMDADPVCASTHAEAVKTRHFIVNKDDGSLANVFVYVKSGLAGQKAPAPSGEAVLDQVNCLYTPYVSGLQAGQPLKIKNSDPTAHNVHCKTKNNQGFNFAQSDKGMESTKSFDKQEVMIQFKCDVHPWMFAYVGVIEHPYFAVTGQDGTFKIANLPAGDYEVEIWHAKGGSKTSKISVKDGQENKLDFAIEAPQKKKKEAAEKEE